MRGFSLDRAVLVCTSTNQRAVFWSRDRGACILEKRVQKLAKWLIQACKNDDFPPVEDWDIRLSVSFNVKYSLIEGSICRHLPL